MYPQLAEWWSHHPNWDAIPPQILPRLGWVVKSGDTLLCAGFLYHDQSALMTQMEWIVSNPDNAPRTSLKALNLLVGTIVQYASDNGLVIFSSVSSAQKALIRLYERHGIRVTETGMTNLLRIG
jgi:hypothetical protein